MDLEAEIAYQKSAPELSQPVVATTPERFQEYANPTRSKTDPFHCFLAAIHRMKPRRIYEIGSGAGELTTRLAKAGYEVTAVELSPEIMAIAKRRAELDGVQDRVKHVLGDALTHREERGSFDLVIANLVLHHLHADLEAALDSMCYHMNPDGAALIYEPVSFSPLVQWMRDRSGVPKHLSPNERQLDAADLGRIRQRFQETKTSYFFILARLAHFFPPGDLRTRYRRWLERLDSLLVPFLRHFSGSIVMEARGLSVPRK